MSDNHLSVTDGHSLSVSALSAVCFHRRGAFHLWGGALPLARTWPHASPGSLYSILRRCGAQVACGRARGLRSQSKAFASGAVTCGAREVLTICSRARIVERNCKCSIRVGCAMGLGFICRSRRFVRSVVRR